MADTDTPITEESWSVQWITKPDADSPEETWSASVWPTEAEARAEYTSELSEVDDRWRLELRRSVITTSVVESSGYGEASDDD